MLSVSSTLGYPAGCSHAHLSPAPAPAHALSSSRQLAARPKPPRPWGSGGRHRSSKEHRRPAAAQTDWNNKQTEGRGPLMERGKREDGDSLPVVNWVKWWCQVVDVKTISWMLSMQRCSDAWLDCKSASSNRLGSNSHILTYVYLYGALHTYAKIASETDILILQMQISIMDANKVQIKDNAIQTVEIEKDEDPMRADEDVMAMPQYNKPKKANNAKVMPQDYECTQEDAQVIEYMKGQDKETVLVRIGDAWVDRDDMDCLFLDDVQVNNGAVISTYIQLMRHEEHLLHREGGNVYMENSFITQLLKRDGATDATTFDYSKGDKVQTWVQKYLDADMVFLPVNIVKFHWYLAVVNASKCEVYVLDSF